MGGGIGLRRIVLQEKRNLAFCAKARRDMHFGWKRATAKLRLVGIFLSFLSRANQTELELIMSFANGASSLLSRNLRKLYGGSTACRRVVPEQLPLLNSKALCAKPTTIRPH